jgi:hypothetical protein
MSYNIVRNKKTGYVSMVEKGRDTKGNVVTKAYICGLGSMTQEEFKHFQKWAHSIKDQRMRRERVLACPLVATETTRVERKVTGVKQRKTTVKRAPKIKKDVSDREKRKARTVREKEWFAALTPEQKKEYKEKQIKRLKETQKELKGRFKRITQIHTPVKAQPVYEIRDLTKAQELEAEIKTLRGKKVDKSLIREREKKIKSILGKKYKSCREVAVAAKKGEVLIDD